MTICQAKSAKQRCRRLNIVNQLYFHTAATDNLKAKSRKLFHLVFEENKTLRDKFYQGEKKSVKLKIMKRC